MSPCFAALTIALDQLEFATQLGRHSYPTGEFLPGEQPCFDALREIDLLLRSEQRHAANLFEVTAYGIGGRRPAHNSCDRWLEFVVVAGRCRDLHLDIVEIDRDVCGVGSVRDLDDL